MLLAKKNLNISNKYTTGNKLIKHHPMILY